MKRDWEVGDRFIYCVNKDSDERGTLVGKVNIGQKFVVDSVYKDCVDSDGYIFYFDEIKRVITVNSGEVKCNTI